MAVVGWILLGILALLLLLLAVRVKAVIAYADKGTTLDVAYLFFKFRLYPAQEPKKPKKEKAEKPPKEKEPKEEKPKDPNKKNPIKQYYENNGVFGFLLLLNKTLHALGGTLRSLYHTIVIHELVADMTISGKDAADTAVRYGKTCAYVFPAMGTVCANMRVRRYDLNIEPDFLALRDHIEANITVSVRPLTIIWAVLVLAVKLVFQVGLRFLRGAKPPKAPPGEKVEPPQNKTAQVANPPTENPPQEAL